MEFERVGPISVCCVLFQVFGKIDDHDGIKGAFLRHVQACKLERFSGSIQMGRAVKNSLLLPKEADFSSL